MVAVNGHFGQVIARHRSCGSLYWYQDTARFSGRTPFEEPGRAT